MDLSYYMTYPACSFFTASAEHVQLSTSLIRWCHN